MKGRRVKGSLRASLFDGIFASCMSGMTGDYVAPFALALRASVGQIGILSASTSLVSSLIQLESARLTEIFKSRKRVIVLFVILHILTLFPAAFIPYLFTEGTAAVWALIACITLTTSFSALAAPAWASLMAEYIPMAHRGAYFGWRNKIMIAVTVIGSFISGLILNCFKRNILAGFSLIILIAVACRVVSCFFLTRMHEPVCRIDKTQSFSFIDFIRRARESNFAKFVFFVSSLNFCVNLASPYFSVFMLRDLKFNYLTYTVLVITVAVMQLLSFDRWGRHADRVGNIKVLKVTSFFIASLPLWWIFCQHPAYLIFAQALSGFAWSGFNPCAVNFIYDAVTPQKRIRCIAYFNVSVGIATCLGALCGGALLNVLPELFKYKLLSLFLLASICRFIVAIGFSGRIREVRKTQHISSKDLFYSVIGIRPMGTTEQALGGEE